MGELEVEELPSASSSGLELFEHGPIEIALESMNEQEKSRVITINLLILVHSLVPGLPAALAAGIAKSKLYASSSSMNRKQTPTSFLRHWNSQIEHHDSEPIGIIT